MVRSRRIAGVLVATLASVALVVPAAHAEGNWESTFYNIVKNFETRRWTDAGSDVYATSLFIKECYQVNGNRFDKMKWELRKNRSLRPDVSLGEKENACRNTTGLSVWSNPGSGTFFLRYNGVTSGDTNKYYAAKSIKVTY